MYRGRDHIGEAEQVSEPVDAMNEFLVGPDRQRQIGHRCGIGVACAVGKAGRLAREEGERSPGRRCGRQFGRATRTKAVVRRWRRIGVGGSFPP
jgi:hypothetical protein